MEEHKHYYGYYKCRMCGKEFTDFCSPTVEIALDEVHDNRHRLTSFHWHDDGTIGYADFIGFKPEEKR